MRFLSALLPVAALALAACVHTNAVMLDPGARYTPVPPHEVRVYLEEYDVPWEFEKIAVIHGRADIDFTDESELIRAMQEKAGELGAHAIILRYIVVHPGLEAPFAHWHFDDGDDVQGQVVAIRFVESQGTGR
jgi:hypothetical protein